MTPEQVRLRALARGILEADLEPCEHPRWSRQSCEDVLALIEERLELRRLLFGTHSCPGKYGDDGELQCNTCRIDFLRDEWEAISAQLHAEGLRELEARVGNVGGWLTWLTERDKLIEERDRLREALRKHGEHEEVCASWMVIRSPDWPRPNEPTCNCGLCAALGEQEMKP